MSKLTVRDNLQVVPLCIFKGKFNQLHSKTFSSKVFRDFCVNKSHQATCYYIGSRPSGNV